MNFLSLDFRLWSHPLLLLCDLLGSPANIFVVIVVVIVIVLSMGALGLG